MLFTDIEGSTRLLKQLGERYGEVLADHRRLLREAFAAHAGHGRCRARSRPGLLVREQLEQLRHGQLFDPVLHRAYGRTLRQH